MAAARPKETEVTQFRARPWPVVRGSERDLDAKRKSGLYSTGRSDIDHNDFADLLMRVEREFDLQWLKAKSLNRHLGLGLLQGPSPLDFDLFAQESWRAQVCYQCYLPVDANQLMGAEADAAFADLKARWCDDGTVGRDQCFGVRGPKGAARGGGGVRVCSRVCEGVCEGVCYKMRLTQSFFVPMITHPQ